MHKSIKRVVPRNRFSMVENLTSIDPKMFKVPEDKYYGVNFTKIPKGLFRVQIFRKQRLSKEN